MLKLYEFLRQFEYHKDDKYIFIGFNHANELSEFIGKEWVEGGLDCNVNCGCLVFNVEELINTINTDWTEEIVEMLNELNR